MKQNKRLQRISLVVVLCLLAVVSVVYLFTAGDPTMEMFLRNIGFRYDRCDSADGCLAFFNVGNGDCCAVYDNDTFGLVDTGVEEYSSSLIAQLEELQVKTIDFVVISHPHDDHTGGYTYLFDKFSVKRLLIAQCAKEDWEDYGVYQTVIDCSREHGTEIVYISDGMTAQIGNVHLTFFQPLPHAAEENDRSVFTMIEYDTMKCIVTGDAGTAAETVLLKRGYSVDADIIKVGHHGSKTSTSQSLLEAVTPDYAVICVGDNNYGHPNSEVTQRLQEQNIPLYRTDTVGRVVFSLREDTITPVIQ